jgi:hypothetical protein
MSKKLAEHFLKTDIGLKWLKNQDYNDIYSSLGLFCSKYTDSYEIPQPKPIVEQIKIILEKTKK